MCFFHYCLLIKVPNNSLQICQLRAEVAEKDRDLKSKLLDKQKIHAEAIETLQVC